MTPAPAFAAVRCAEAVSAWAPVGPRAIERLPDSRQDWPRQAELHVVQYSCVSILMLESAYYIPKSEIVKKHYSNH